jgi:flagellar protein FlgJ
MRQLGTEPNLPSLKPSNLSGYRQHPVITAPWHDSIPVQKTPQNQGLVRDANKATVPADSPQQFILGLWPAAEQAASRIGLPPEALLAQAALETGWGQHVMSTGDGRSSNNLFGIKADPRWDGERVRRITLEYEDGVAVQRRESFRAYESVDESFQDYIDFLKNNPRYLDALTKTHDIRAYFQALQQAGYATDPRYADKILSLLEGSEMQRAMAQLKSDAPLPL